MDPIADMLTSIRNAQAVSKKKMKVPFSKVKYEIAKVLERNGFVEGVEKKGRDKNKLIEIKLKYKDKKAVISGLKRVSKPGQRIYIGVHDINPVRSGYGIAIISTSQGLMTGKEARKKKLGGELICRIW